jgi:hypothetical protein
MKAELFRADPREYALEMVAEGLISADSLTQALLAYMSYDDVRDALDANELSPRFDDDETGESTAEAMGRTLETGE